MSHLVSLKGTAVMMSDLLSRLHGFHSTASTTSHWTVRFTFGLCDVMRGRVILGRYIPATWLVQGLQTIMDSRPMDYNSQSAGQPGPSCCPAQRDKSRLPWEEGRQQLTSNTGARGRRLERFMFCFGIKWTSF